MANPRIATIVAIAVMSGACGKTSGQAPVKKDGVNVEQANNNLAAPPATVKGVQQAAPKQLLGTTSTPFYDPLAPAITGAGTRGGGTADGGK